MPDTREPAEILCEMIRNGEVSCIGPDGKLTPEAEAYMEKRFAESEEAFRPLIEKLKASRRLTAEDMSFYVGPAHSKRTGF